MTVLSKNLKDLYNKMVTKPDNDEKEKQEAAFRFIKQYVTLNRAELFFAEKAILIEGDTERLLISAMMKKFDIDNEHTPGYVPLLSQNISVIEVGAYSHVFRTLLEFLEIRTLIITDLDCGKKSDKRHAEKCAFSEANVITNASLKSFLGTDEIKKIIALTDNDKIFVCKGNHWIADAEGNLRIAFQKEENGYTARSFEDAFLSVNFQFVFNNKTNFSALKCHDKILKDSKNYYDISNECIGSKTGFALDILLYSDENYSNWKTPLYINEGLKWLTK
jgi:predicted ATP-dependent endonuclease of OLD family